MGIYGAVRLGVGRSAVALAVLAATMLGGCGDPKKAYDQGLNDAFDKLTHDNCVNAATEGGATADLAERYCGCVVKQLAPLTSAQKLALNESHPGSSPELHNVMAACRTQIQQQAGS